MFSYCISAKSKNAKKKNNAAKKAELNQKVPMGSDLDAFKDLSSSSTTSPSSTAYVSPATTPDAAPTTPMTTTESVAPLPSKPAEKVLEENHVEARKEASPPAEIAGEPEVRSSPQPEVVNHVIDNVKAAIVIEDEKLVVDNDSAPSSKSGSQLKLRYDYKDSKNDSA